VFFCKKRGKWGEILKGFHHPALGCANALPRVIGQKKFTLKALNQIRATLALYRFFPPHETSPTLINFVGDEVTGLKSIRENP
jgi:hypothetical protein